MIADRSNRPKRGIELRTGTEGRHARARKEPTRPPRQRGWPDEVRIMYDNPSANCILVSCLLAGRIVSQTTRIFFLQRSSSLRAYSWSLSGSKPHIMFATSQKCYDPVSKLASSSVIYHYVEQDLFSFPYCRDVVIGCKSCAVFRRLCRVTGLLQGHVRFATWQRRFQLIVKAMLSFPTWK